MFRGSPRPQFILVALLAFVIFWPHFGSLFADYKASATHAGTDDSDELPVNLRAVAPAVRYNRRYGFLRFAVRR